MGFANGTARRWSGAALQTLFTLSLLVTAGLLAWSSLRIVDFGYPWWYGTLSIDRHIEQWGPRNRYRHGFETTTRQERLAIFSAIATAVHKNGEGLDAIRYHGNRGEALPFLRAPEKRHLQSVARLIDLMYGAFYWAAGAFVISAIALHRLGIPPPSLPRILLGTATGTAVMTLAVMAVGPTKVFYAAHRWVFPPGEQWYFTYQESLMTTLMKAPDLFGGIATLLAAATLLYFALLVAITRFCLCPGAAPADKG